MSDATSNSIRSARLRAGLTQIDLALGAGISLSTVRLAERGIASARTLASVAKRLGVPLDSISPPGGAQ